MASINVNINERGSIWSNGNTIYYNATAGAKTDTLLKGGYDLSTLIGLPSITLKVDGNGVAASPSSESAWIANTGCYVTLNQVGTIYVKGESAGGTQDASATYSCQLDSTAPIIVSFIMGGAKIGETIWVKGSGGAYIAGNASDSQSGVWKYSFNGTESESAQYDITDTTEGTKTVAIDVWDNVGNKATSSVTYSVDNTAPVITVTGGTSGVWTNKDIELAISASDSGSGVKTLSDTKKTFTTAKGTILETSYDFTAVDYVNNGTMTTYVVRIDKELPTITISKDSDLPTWVKSVKVTATFDDGTGSGIDRTTQRYSTDNGATWQYCPTGVFDINANGTILVKVNDRAGNETLQAFEVNNVDNQNPEIEITADLVTISVEQTISAAISDPEPGSGLNITKYSTDGGVNWISYTPGQELVCTVNDTTYTFYANDKAGNEITKDVTFENIYANDAEYVKIRGEKKMVDEQNHLTVEVTAESNFTVTETGELSVGELVLYQQMNNEGSVSAGSIFVKSDAAVYGNLYTAQAITVDNGVTLTMDKDQYDKFMAETVFTEDNAGKLLVEHVVGNALTQDDVEDIIDKANLNNVEFQQDLIDIGKLTFDTEDSLSIAFQDGYGTSSGDTIRFKKNADVVLGNYGRIIDLKGGNNTIQLDQAAYARIESDLVNVSSVKLAKLANGVFSDVTFATGRSAALTVESLASFAADDITAGDKALTINVKKGIADNLTGFTAEGITGSVKADTLDFGTYTDVCIYGEVALGEGNDQLKVAKDSSFMCSSIDFGDGKDSFTINSRSKAQVYGDVAGLNKFAMGNGSYDKKTYITTSTEFIVANVVATDYNDTYVVGNYSDLWAKSISFGAGNDKLAIGNNSSAFVVDSVDFGTGKDQIAIGDLSTVTLRSENADSVTKFTIGKESTVFLSAELYDAVTKIGKNSQVYNLGSYDVAKNFTKYDLEHADNTFESAMRIGGFTDYNGWLHDELDSVDFLANQSGSTLNIDFGGEYTSLQVSTDGIEWSDLTAANYILSDKETAGFRIKEDVEGAFKYSIAKAITE